MNVRTAMASVTALLLVGALAGCTQTISGTAGPRPTVSGSGDFPTGSDTPTDDPTSTDTPTDDPTSTDTPTDQPTDDPTGVTTDDPGSVESLCSNIDVANQQGQDVPADVVKSYVSTIILAWGIANSDDDPYSKADAATTSTCPDVRTAVLKLMDLPDLASTK